MLVQHEEFLKFGHIFLGTDANMFSCYVNLSIQLMGYCDLCQFVIGVYIATFFFAKEYFILLIY